MFTALLKNLKENRRTIVFTEGPDARILEAAARLLSDPQAYRAMAHAANPYGDGRACRRIADAVLYHFGRSDRPPEAFQG